MKQKLLLTAFIFCVFGWHAAKANETEPNNTRNTANTLPLNGKNNGVINPSGDVDWYKVSTTSDGRLDITLTDFSNADYVNIYFYDNDGVTQLNSGTATTNNSVTISTDGLAAGTYYVKIQGYNSGDTATYSLSNTLTPAPVANDMEPDSSRSTALTLALNGRTTGHLSYYYNNHRDSADEYKVTTTSDGLLRLTLTDYPTSNNDYVNYILYDNDGITQLNSGTASVGTASVLNTDGLAAGTYYIKIVPYNYNNGGYASYSLADTLIPAPVANDLEPNNSKATADILTLNSIVTGHIGYYYKNLRDSSDWYRLTTNTDGMIRLTITTEPSTLNAYINYTLYDNNGTTVLSSNTIGSNTTNSYTIDGLAKGTYYVRMYQYNTNDYVSYKLADSLFTYQYAADSSDEPNGYAAEAKTIPANEATQGHFGFYYKNVRDTTDWFKINYTGSGNLSLTLNHLPHLSDGTVDYVNFYVYKDTSSSSIYQTTFGHETSDVVNLISLSEGYYYIKITQYNSNDFEAYSLLDSFTQVDKAKISLTSADSAANCDSTGSITFKCKKSHSPYSVQLYDFGKKYGNSITTNGNAVFNDLPAGSYYAIVYGDGATGKAHSTSDVVTIMLPLPTALNVSNIKSTQAKLNWTPAICATSDSIEYRVDRTSPWSYAAATNSGSYILKNLSPSTTYDWGVEAVDSSNGYAVMSGYVQGSSFTTTATADDGSIYSNQFNNGNPNSINGIAIYPNPASSQLHIRLGNTDAKTEGKVLLALKDVSGKIVWSAENSNAAETMNVDVSRLPGGIYMLQIIKEDGTVSVHKVIIAK